MSTPIKGMLDQISPDVFLTLEKINAMCEGLSLVETMTTQNKTATPVQFSIVWDTDTYKLVDTRSLRVITHSPIPAVFELSTVAFFSGWALSADEHTRVFAGEPVRPLPN